MEEEEKERVPGSDAESRKRHKQVRRMCSNRYFAAGQAMEEGLWVLVDNNRGGRRLGGEYLHSRLSSKGISYLSAEAGAVRFFHD